MQRMKTGLRDLGVLFAILIVALAGAVGPANSQEKQEKDEVLELEQIALTEDHIKGYLKIGSKLSKVFERIDNAGGEPDKQLLNDLEAVAKEGGFKSFDELENVVANVTFVMSGINEDDGGKFKEPVELLKEELAETEADTSISGDEKKQLIASIKESIAHTPKLKFPANVALVQKHFTKLAQLFQE